MSQPFSVGADQVPPYEVACIELDARLEFGGHQHVTVIETSDPDGGRTRWSCVQVIAAIREGERFVVATGGDGEPALLEPGLCPRCPFATLLVDPSRPQPARCV